MSENNNINENFEENLDKNLTFATDNEVEHPQSPEEEDYEEILPACPSQFNFHEVQSGAASESVAIQNLEHLFNNGSLTGSEMALYKKRFLLLNDLLEKTRDNEFHLLQRSKKWTLQVEKDNHMLAEANDFPEDSNTEVSKMRKSLLKFYNDNLSIEDRLETLLYTVTTLEEEKKMLEGERTRLPGVRDKEMKKNFELSIDQLKDETSKLIIENKNLHENTKEYEENIRNLNDEYDIILDKMNDIKSKLIEANTLPNQYAKMIDKIRKEKNEFEEKEKVCNLELESLYKLKNGFDKEIREKEELIGRSKIEFNKSQETLIETQSKLDKFKKNIEERKEEEIQLHIDKSQIELDSKFLINEKKKLHENIIVKTKSKDKALKTLKHATLQLKSAEETIETVKKVHEMSKLDLEMYPKSDFSIKESIENKIMEIQKRKKLFEFQNMFSEVEKAKLTKNAQEEERLLYDLSDLRIEVIELTRLAQIKADEREQKAKEFILKEKRFTFIIEELKEKFLNIQDNKKKYIETQGKLDDFAKKYNIIQTERNKCASLINAVTQKGSEMREKIRILNNEIEILQTNLNQKDDYVQRQRSKYMAVVSIRDSLRAEISKQNVILAIQKEKRDQFQLDIQRMNQLGNQAEEAMVHLRKQNDFSLQSRNDRAVQLIERNEEVCILQEKYNIKEEIIKGGEKEIQIRNEEIEFLKQNVKDLKRQIELLRSRRQNKGNLERDIVNLKIQVSLCQDRLIEMEYKVENPEENNRARILQGNYLPPLEIQAKFEELHIKLTFQEDLLLEKILLFEAVSKLVENLRSKIVTDKMDTVDLAKSINNYKSQMCGFIKKLKAKTAELTMNMCESMRLQQEVKKQEAALKTLYQRCEGKDEFDFDRLELSHITKQQTLSDFGIKQYQLTNGKLTTAEPRPNAYIPENESELPIPRPYGVNAPFRPTEPGSNMRHIKKQKLKPIEI